MNVATWRFDGRDLTEITLNRMPWGTRPGVWCWSYSDDPPDDSGWSLTGRTADGERLWTKIGTRASYR